MLHLALSTPSRNSWDKFLDAARREEFNRVSVLFAL